MNFIGIKSIEELLKLAAISQVSIPYGEQTNAVGISGEQGASSTSISEPLAKPVSSIKLPGAVKKPMRRFPTDLLDEVKLQEETESPLI
jgi:hypothetical protein